MDCVEDLANLVGLSEPGNGVYDWVAVETSLGRSLPRDYKALVERFPPGRFQGFVELIRPGQGGYPNDDFLGYFAHRLNDMREWRKDEPRRFPLPIHPESSGLLPWGRTHRAALFFWLTGPEDPDCWQIVTTDAEFTHWHILFGTVCDFLTEVVSGRIDGKPYGIDLSGQKPMFVVEQTPKPTPPMPSGASFWTGFQMSQDSPQNEFAALAAVLGPAPVVPESVDWTSTERRLGIALPADYKEFINTYGPGVLGNVTIAAPGGPTGLNLEGLIDAVHEQAINEPTRGGFSAPIHPQPGGLIAWGRRPDGWTCCWAPTSPDPDLWGTVLIDSRLASFDYNWSDSFSTLLTKYANPQLHSPFSGFDDPLEESVLFVPGADRE